LDICRNAAIEVFTMQLYSSKHLLGNSTNNDSSSLLEKVVSQIVHFQIRAKVSEILQEFSKTQDIVYKYSNSSESNLHMHIRVFVKNKQKKKTQFNTFELKIDLDRMTIIRSSKERPYGYSFTIQKLEQIEDALENYLSDHK
jgi:aminoglycoside phosphotransferase family enzyme